MAQPPAPLPPSQQPSTPQPPTPQPPYQPYAPAVADGPAPGVRFAGVVGRFIAYLIDGFIAAVLVWVLIIALGIIVAIFGSAGADTLAGITSLITILGAFVIMLLYFPFFWQRSGQTPGMRIMRIRVVRDADGGPIGWGPAIIRLIGYWVSAAVFYLGFIWILVDKRRRGWHDLMAGTCVIEV
jgi:uncharacterized RDD family membrane protein YckC